MALNALFDPKKKALVEDALKKGDLSPVFRRKPLTDTVPGSDEYIRYRKSLSMKRRINDMCGLIPHYNHCQPPEVFEVSCQLYAAIREGDARKAMIAITCGADVHSEAGVVPPTPRSQTFIFETVTPLKYAEKIGQSEIAKLLRICGAKA